MQKILFIGIGGFLGAIIRYLITTKMIGITGHYFPYGTLIVNVLGGFLIGFIMTLCLSSDILSPNIKLMITVGLIGGLSTFSTFSYDTYIMFVNNKIFLGSINVISNIVLSIVGVIIGKYFYSFVSHLV